MRFSHLVFYLFSLSIFLLPTSGEAQVSYSVTPRVIDVEAEARDIIKQTITITNNSETTYTSIFPSVNEISLNEGEDLEAFRGPTQVDRPTAITSWLELPRKQIRIAPGGTQEVTLTIRMNPNTAPGEYHGLLGFGSGRIRDDAEEQVREGRAPSIVVTIRVEDARVERMDLSGFVIDKFVTSANNQAVQYTLSNPGDTPVVPSGEIIFYDDAGKEVASIPANPDGRSLGPGEEVGLRSSVPIDGLIGQYKAFLNVSYGAAQAGSVYDTVFFYVLPWQKLLIIFLIIVSGAIAVTLFLYYRFGLNEDHDGSEQIAFNFKDTPSDSQEHDIDLKANS